MEVIEMENGEKEQFNIGYTTLNGIVVSTRKLGSAKTLTAKDNTGRDKPARRIRTRGRNVIPFIPAKWGWVKNEEMNTSVWQVVEAEKPAMVAYIDETKVIERTCYMCKKELADGIINYQMRFTWGTKEDKSRRIHRTLKGRKADSDDLNNPPINGYDIYSTRIEEGICLDCSKIK